MELTKENYAELLTRFPQDTKVYFYERLAHNLTISCRGIWSNELLSDAEKVEQMKWLNEIQHRIISKISVERLVCHEWKESDIIGMIENYVKQAPSIGSEVAWAINNSYKTTLNNVEN